MFDDRPSVGIEDKDIAITAGALGLFSLVFGLSSQWLRGRIFLTSSVLAMVFGICLGPQVLNLVQVVPGGWEDGTETDASKLALMWLTRVVLCVQVLSAGVTLPVGYLARRPVRRSLAILLGPGMAIKTAIVGVFVKVLFGVGWLEGVLVGSCLAPTDPVLAAAVVKGTFAEQHVPPYIRQILLCESGINDGAATPLFLAFLLPLTRATFGEAVKDWWLDAVLEELLLPIVAGAFIGWLARIALRRAKTHNWVDRESSLVYTVALALGVCGLMTYVDSNEVLACFCAGVVLGGDGSFREEELHNHFSEGIDGLLDISVFFTLGTVLPWHAWLQPNDVFPISKLFGLAILTLTLRRMPAILLLRRVGLLPIIKTPKEAAFVGWFGPMGVGAIYYALKAGEMLPEDNILKQNLFDVVAWIVVSSVIIHGVTLPTFLLASSIHPIFHPKMLVQTVQSRAEDEQGTEVTERSQLLGTFLKFARGESREEQEEVDEEEGGDVDDGEVDRLTTSRQRDAADPDEGLPISRRELNRILTELNDDDDDGQTQGRKMLRDGSAKLSQAQKEALLGEGTGLNQWDLAREIEVYDEGNMLILADEDGNVTTRPIFAVKRRRPTRAHTYT